MVNELVSRLNGSVAEPMLPWLFKTIALTEIKGLEVSVERSSGLALMVFIEVRVRVLDPL